jgi:hypothetical protein
VAATSPDRDSVFKTDLKCNPGLPSCCNGIGLGAVTNPDAIGDELGQEVGLNPQVGEIHGDRGGLAVAPAVGCVVGLLKEGHGLTFANGEITHYLRDHGYAIKVPPTWRDLYASGQKLMRNGVDAAEVAGRLGIRAERWREICGACRVRVVAFGVEELVVD